jgi:hypothetical protein
MTENVKTSSSESGVRKERALSRRIVRLAIVVPLVGVLWYFVGRSLYRGFREIEWSTLSVNWLMVAASMLALMCARLTNALNCKQVLAAMGARVRASQVVPIIWTASLGRYVPGKMAVVAGAMMMLMRLGIRVQVAGAALFLSTALMILVGLIASTPLMLTATMREKMPGAWMVSLAMLAVGVVCLHPKVFTRLCNLALVRIKRQPLPDSLQGAPYLRALGMTLLRTLFLGVALWCAARAFGDIDIRDFPLALGSAGAASVAGFLAVFAPAGLGVHEGIYMLTLTPVLGPSVAVLVVMFRFLNVITDAITGGIGMLVLKAQAGTPDPLEVRAVARAK